MVNPNVLGVPEGSADRPPTSSSEGVRTISIPSFIRKAVVAGMAAALTACSAESMEAEAGKTSTHLIDGPESAEQPSTPRLGDGLTLKDDHRSYSFAFFNMPAGQSVVVDPYDPAFAEASEIDQEVISNGFITAGEPVTEVKGALTNEAPVGAGYKVRVFAPDETGAYKEVMITFPAKSGEIEGYPFCTRKE